MHAEFHELVALALLVVGGEVVLLLSVGNGDDVRGLVDTTLSLTLVAGNDGVGVLRVNRGIASLTEGRVRAVRAVDGVQKSVEEPAPAFDTSRVKDVVSLEEDAVLRALCSCQHTRLVRHDVLPHSALTR